MLLRVARWQIYVFDGAPQEIDGLWKGRVIWNGSKDLQDLSISIRKVTANDTGTYVCEVQRQFLFDSYTPSFTYSKVIHLVVSEEGKAPKLTLNRRMSILWP